MRLCDFPRSINLGRWSNIRRALDSARDKQIHVGKNATRSFGTLDTMCRLNIGQRCLFAFNLSVPWLANLSSPLTFIFFVFCFVFLLLFLFVKIRTRVKRNRRNVTNMHSSIKGTNLFVKRETALVTSKKICFIS